MNRTPAIGTQRVERWVGAGPGIEVYVTHRETVECSYQTMQRLLALAGYSQTTATTFTSPERFAPTSTHAANA